jgi:hypothetical protein
VRDAVDLEVLVGGRLVVGDSLAYVGVEDLGAAAREAAETAAMSFFSTSSWVIP